MWSSTPNFCKVHPPAAAITVTFFRSGEWKWVPVAASWAHHMTMLDSCEIQRDWTLSLVHVFEKPFQKTCGTRWLIKHNKRRGVVPIRVVEYAYGSLTSIIIFAFLSQFSCFWSCIERLCFEQVRVLLFLQTISILFTCIHCMKRKGLASLAFEVILLSGVLSIFRHLIVSY